MARVEGYEMAYMLERLNILGYLIMHTRQLDMVLGDPGKVQGYQEQMIQQISTFVEIN